MKEMNIRKILVPVDFSNTSMSALQTAVCVARQHNASMILLYVNDNDYSLYSNDKLLKPAQFDDCVKKLSELSRSVVNSDNINCSFSIESGDVTHCILKSASEENADLIVMGKNGSNGPSRQYAGTNASQVAKKTRTPVIIVPEGICKMAFGHILLPVRPLYGSLYKYDFIRPFLMKDAPTVTILNLRNPDYENELQIIHHLSLQLKERLKRDNIRYEMDYYFKDKNFASHIIEKIESEQNKPDLLVITAESEKSNRDFYISGFVREIIHKASIPVLIIRPNFFRMNQESLLNNLEKAAVMQ